MKKYTIDKINSLRNNEKKSGWRFKEYGKSNTINDYSNLEILEMERGIYSSSKMLLVDGEYFVNMNDVTEIICQVEDVSLSKKTKDIEINGKAQHAITNIGSFYVKNYVLKTLSTYEGKIEHGISRFLVNAGAITRGRGKFTHLFCVVNQTQEMQSFEQGMFPKDLFLPIKFDINRLFFGDQYRLSNFKVEFNTALF